MANPSGTTKLQIGMPLRALATSHSGDIKEGKVYTILGQDSEGMFWVKDDAGDPNWAFHPEGGSLNTDFEEFEVVSTPESKE